MLDKLIDEFLTLNSPEIKEIKENATILGGFLALVKKLDAMDKVEKRFYEWSRSLYQATATDEKIENIDNVFKEFFGLPTKPIGKGLPLKLRLSPSVKQLNGVKTDQALYIKKLNVGEFYGALFPWQKNSGKIEIHLGFCAPSMTEGAIGQLSTVVKKYLSKAAMDQMNMGTGGTIRGIGLPSFLQMSEMESSTFKLKITSLSRIGYLRVSEGKLIGAETEGITGKDAAYRIISWEKVVIEIETLEPNQEDEIQQPLMHVLMESLKIKDEGDAPFEKDEDARSPSPPPPESETPAPVGLSDAIPIGISTVKPFERIAPPAPIIRKKKSRATSFLVGSAVGLPLLLLVGLIGASYLKNLQQESAYQQVMASLESEINPDIKEKQLIDFMDKYNPKKHLSEIEAKIKEVRGQIETRDFEAVTLKIGTLAIDNTYEQKAAEIYNHFLSKYPESRYADEIKSALVGIKALLDDTYYQKLLSNEKMDLGQRFDAYQDYIARFPDGRHREDIEKLLMDMGEQYYTFIKLQDKVCDEKKAWEKCIVFCENYVKVFDNSPRIDEILKLKKNISDKAEFHALRRELETEKSGHDYIAMTNAYKNFLADHPDSSVKSEIIDAIDRLKGKVADQKQWQSLQAYATDSGNSVNARMQRLETYLDKNNKGAYSRPARDLYEKLMVESVQANRTQRPPTSTSSTPKQNQLTEAQKRAMGQRLEQASVQFSERVNASKKRFHADKDTKTFKDSLTGNVWALLDSHQHLGYCLNYDSALQYTADLRWGGHGDWRLPTSEELAALYKNEPFFPDSGAPWYWTSEAYAKGYHTVADIVTSKHERIFMRQSVNQKDCGAVRAIRP